MSMTSGEVAHAPLDPPGSGNGANLHAPPFVEDTRAMSESSFGAANCHSGRMRGSRVVDNGLGFDLTRVTAQADSSTEDMVDPVIEVLAFFGLALLPVRGAGVDQRMRGARSRNSRL